MSLYGFLAFCAVYALAVATPGPGVAAVLSRSLARGTHGAPAYIAGFLVGDLVWFCAAATGLSALAESAHAVFLLVRYAGAAYLLYLAWRMWTSSAQSLEVSARHPAENRRRLFLSGLSLTLGNPKTMVFFVALLPTVVHLRTLHFTDYLFITLAIAVILPAVLGAYALAAARARHLFQNPRSIRLLNRGAGTAMAGAAVAVASQ